MSAPSLAIERTDNDTVAAVLDAATEITGTPVRDARRLGRGRNNVTLLLDTARGPFVAKHYPSSPGDERDRFNAEIAALRFMAANGFDCVPELVGASASARVAVMDGRGIPAGLDARDSDIKACIAFADQLHAARNAEGARDIGPASEACPAPMDTVRQIRARREKLSCATSERHDLARFLDSVFDPALDTWVDSARAALDSAEIDFDTPLPQNLQTLSPSDFGLHNAIQRDDGRLVFVDFEYFGWDDPVRLTCDFILHPGHRLDHGQKRRFAAAASSIYDKADLRFADRLAALYPLIALRWCMIILNEFLPERMARRRDAGETGSLEDVLTRQLDKATRLVAGMDDSKRLMSRR